MSMMEKDEMEKILNFEKISHPPGSGPHVVVFEVRAVENLQLGEIVVSHGLIFEIIEAYKYGFKTIGMAKVLGHHVGDEASNRKTD